MGIVLCCVSFGALMDHMPSYPLEMDAADKNRADSDLFFKFVGLV